MLLLPALQAFMRHFPEAQVDVPAERRNRKAFELIEGIRHLEDYARPAANRREALQPVSGPYRLDAYEMESFADLVEVLGVPRPSPGGVFLAPPSSPLRKEAPEAPSSPLKRHVAVFPGGTHPAKCWPLKKYRKVVEDLLRKDFGVLVLGGESEKNLAAELCAGLAVENLTGRTTLGELVDIFHRVGLLVSGDSGLLHLAALCGCPTVSLFGPSSPLKWAPRGAGHVALSRHVECAPCSRFGRIPDCRHEWHCLHDIEPGEVLDAVQHVRSQPCPERWI